MNWTSTRAILAAVLVTATLLFAGCTGPADGGNGTVGEGGGAAGPGNASGADGGNDTGGVMGNETDGGALGGNTTSLTTGVSVAGPVS